ncbi:hypothetical protein PDE_02177 [Penicillium oxalicum 114-2]|uniref:Uncharacterized protein n=1 Tax=Penicillium oxalicum (strain 114-2 / CGMCC 5302) TaxID=933388 RepID=S7ZAI8_PENO1|nr:hypothetical protein PDE_02177 [Penicillium oxalicum 114-2]
MPERLAIAPWLAVSSRVSLVGKHHVGKSPPSINFYLESGKIMSSASIVCQQDNLPFVV